MLTKKAANDICSFLADVAVHAKLEKQALEFTPGVTTAIGAGLGGLTGLLSAARKKKKNRNYLGSAFTGALAGGGLGLGAGLIPGAMQELGFAEKTKAPAAKAPAVPAAAATPAVSQSGAPAQLKPSAPAVPAASQPGAAAAQPPAQEAGYLTSRDLENRIALDSAAGLAAAFGVSPARRGLAYAAKRGITPSGLSNLIEDTNFGNKLRKLQPAAMNRGGNLFNAPMPTSQRVNALRGAYASGEKLPEAVQNMAKKIPGLEALAKKDPAAALQALKGMYESSNLDTQNAARQMLEHADVIDKAKRKMTYDDFTNKQDARSGVKGLSGWVLKLMLGAGAREGLGRYFGQ